MAFPANIDSRVLLEIEMATNLLMTESGRIQCLNTPDRGKAPRMVIAGCESGNEFRFRHDVGTDTAHEMEALAAAAVYEWALRPELIDHVLFYSTDMSSSTARTRRTSLHNGLPNGSGFACSARAMRSRSDRHTHGGARCMHDRIGGIDFAF